MSASGLTELARQAWSLHDGASDHQWLVRPSAPVLYFGNFPVYERAKVRIVTVALNPSLVEFPKQTPWLRFRQTSVSDLKDYLNVLNTYFHFNPYSRWFSSYDQLLRGSGSSYYGKLFDTALHTDVGSVLATDPTWRKLEKTVRDSLRADGVALWHGLLEVLSPNIVILSTAKEWLKLIEFKPLSDWFPIITFGANKDLEPRKTPYLVKGRWYRLSPQNIALFAYAPAANTPLGSLSKEQKLIAGQEITEAWNARKN